MDEKKEIKKSQPYSLKPTNITWLAEQALRRSTPEKRISASSVLDEILDQAREKAQNPSSSKKSRTSVASVAA